jgi:hypothetical protein
VTSLRVYAVAVLALLVFTGCATIAAHRAEEAKWQALADQITDHYHAPRVPVTVTAGFFGTYHCDTGGMDLGVDGNGRFLLAHELGHHVNHQCGISFAYELSANRFAVEAFQVWGMAEADAVRSVVRQLVYTAKVRGSNQRPPHDACAEAADVLRAYPASPDPRDPGDTTCQNEITSVRPTPRAG